jgi:uncharacterized OsmC-like protein
MKVRVQRSSKTSFLTDARHHIVVSDQPQENGGADAGLTPPELLLASLGSCVAYYVAQFCDARHIDSTGFEVTVEGELLHNPGRIGEITLKVQLPIELEEDRLTALLRTVSHCTIHNTLTTSADIRVQVETPAMALSA